MPIFMVGYPYSPLILALGCHLPIPDVHSTHNYHNCPFLFLACIFADPVSSKNRHPRKWASRKLISTQIYMYTPPYLCLHKHGHPDANIYGEYGYPTMKIGITFWCPYLQSIWVHLCESGTKLDILMSASFHFHRLADINIRSTIN